MTPSATSASISSLVSARSTASTGECAHPDAAATAASPAAGTVVTLVPSGASRATAGGCHVEASPIDGCFL